MPGTARDGAHLECTRASRIIRAVFRRPLLPADRLRLALATGLITAAGTAGALLGFGLKAGTPARPFNAIARLVFGPGSADVWGYEARVTLTGAALHVTTMLLYGVAFSMIGAWHGWRLAATATAVSLLALVMELLLLRRLVPGGVAELLAPGQLVALHVVMALCLAIGMRFALQGFRDDD